MKKIINNSLLQVALLVLVLAAGSCRKENSPLTKASANPQANLIDPGQGPSNTVLTLTGSGLGDIKTVVFATDNVAADFNPVLNTENALIFRVPLDAVPGQQDIIFKNGAGVEFRVPFNVLGLATITGVSNYNYNAGTQLTLTGKNLADVSKVVLHGSTTEAIIISATATSLVIEMPATDIPRTTLDIYNAAGVNTTELEFVSLENALIIFTDDYGPGFSDGSWGPNAISTTVHFNGTASAAKTLPKGNWWVAGFASWNAPNVPFDPAYKYLSFWLKGGLIDHTLYLTGDKRPAGFGNADQTTPIVVPASVWTYFKMPVAGLNLWGTANTEAFKQLGFWTKGPDNADETFYFDDVIITK